jgi:hypothetical protein
VAAAFSGLMVGFWDQFNGLLGMLIVYFRNEAHFTPIDMQFCVFLGEWQGCKFLIL